MKSARFFVTAILLLSAIGSTACGDKKDKIDPAQRQALLEKSKASQQEIEALVKELSTDFKIIILEESQRLPDGTLVSSGLMGQKYNWHRLTLTERKAAKEKVKQLVTATEALNDLEENRGIYIPGAEKNRSRRNGALSFQKSLQRFEEVVGEQFEPQTPGLPPVYHSPVDI